MRDPTPNRDGYTFSAAAISRARWTLAREGDLGTALAALVEKPSAAPDGLFLALLGTFGSNAYAPCLAALLDVARPDVERQLPALFEAQADADFRLTGAEAVAAILAREGVRLAFAYPGTSELCLCDAIGRVPGTRLVNGRGDKEAAFMAAGACLRHPTRAVSVLHAARGVTNAAGAIADSLRNEVPTVFLAGMPSTSSSPFLPPHGESGLFEAMDHLVKWSHEITAPPTEEAGAASARAFVSALRTAFREARQPRRGPALVGIPQDVSEAAWIPWSVLSSDEDGEAADLVSHVDVVGATELILSHRRPVILIDDYLLKLEESRSALRDLAARCGAPVFQLRYRRGPMLFERLEASDVPNFVGWLDQWNMEHRSILHSADLLITLEDRNMYRRVVGELPRCRVIAITSDAEKVRKNLYVSEGDLLIEGDPVLAMRRISAELEMRGNRVELPVPPQLEAGPTDATPVERFRGDIARAIADALDQCTDPVIVDDSQMFGGLIAQSYDELPSRVTVFGDHGGFVGSGISYATGLALSETSSQVVCLLGDQAFGNGVQGLVAAGEQRAPVLYIVCNNGESVSLVQQSTASDDRWLETCAPEFLVNAPNLSCVSVAAALGIDAMAVDLSAAAPESRPSLSELKEALRKAIASGRSTLIELKLPADPKFWAGIWATRGLDEAVQRASAGPTASTGG